MFRPCIDLHQGQVKQIVGGSLTDDEAKLQTNHTSERPSEWFADLYRRDALFGGHVIKLGPGNDPAALAALKAFPGGLQVGGGLNPDNVDPFLDAGASHIIVTSWLFDGDEFNWQKLETFAAKVGRSRLVVDLSCRVRDGRYYVVTNRWQTFTALEVSDSTLERIAQHCAEFLIHAADVEGLCRGIDLELVQRLAHCSPIPVTYAGGARSLDDLRLVQETGLGRVDLTIGSALDIFGGSLIRYQDAIAFNRSLSN